MTTLIFKAQKYMNGEDALTAKGMHGKGKIEDIDEPQHKKKEKKDISPDKKNDKGSTNPLNKNCKFYPFEYARRKSFVANEGRPKSEVAEALKLISS